MIYFLKKFRFNKKENLRKHIRGKHLNIYVPRAQCPICNQKLYKHNQLNIHMGKYHPDGKDEGHRVNSETNYFDCDRCAASFWDLFTFKRHTCEKGRYQLRCPECLIPVKSQSQLQKHMTKCRKLNPHSIFRDIQPMKNLNEKN